MDCTQQQQVLTRQLREEAHYVKDCFTRFSFQAITFSSTILAAIVAASSYYPEHPEVSFACIPIIILLAAVCRIGIHKYSTANRNYGYELHLARTAGLTTSTRALASGAWVPDMRAISWEEAVRAWRVVQATLFESLYETPAYWREHGGLRSSWSGFVKRIREVYADSPHVRAMHHDSLGWLLRFACCLCPTPMITLPVRWLRHHWNRYTLNPETRACLRRINQLGSTAPGYDWFQVDKLARSAGGVYYAGSYIKNVFDFLLLLQFLAVLPLVQATWQYWSDERFEALPRVLSAVILAVIGVTVLWRARRISVRRRLLESGILSIHSCAIVWQAVVLAHFRALRRSGYRHYTEHLASQARHLVAYRFDIHGWVEGDYTIPCTSP